MLSLKTYHITTLLLCILALCTCVSCADEGLGSDVASSAKSGTPRYLAIRIKYDSKSSFTRAEGDANDDEKFDQGVDGEFKMGPSGQVILFDSEDVLCGVDYLEPIEAEEPTYLYIKQLPADDEIDFPNSCLVVLNGSQDIYKQVADMMNERKTYRDVCEILWNADPKDIGYADGDHTYFTMSNSMYYDTDGKLQAPAKFNAEEHIFQTRDSAANDPIIVHVERMLAKMELKESIGSGSDTKAKKVGGEERIYELYNQAGKDVIVHRYFDAKGEPTSLEMPYQIKLTGWNVNALETQSYLFKKVNYSQSGYFTDWNDPDQFRSYWSEDPHYNYAEDKKTPLKYPWQYRLAVNNSLDYYKEKFPNLNDPNTNINYLKNYSYTDLAQGFDEDRIEYVPENTYDPSGYNMESDFDNRTNLLAGTHLIVCAELLTDLGKFGTFTAADVYRDRTGVYYKNPKDCFWALVRAFNDDLQSHVYMKYKYYDWNVQTGTSEKVFRDALAMKNYHYIYNGTVTDWDNKMKEALKKESGYPRGEKVEDIGTYRLYHNGNLVTYEYIQGLNDELFIPATIKDGDGKVLPWLENLEIKTEKGHKLTIFKEINIRYDYLDGGFVIVGEKIGEATPNDIKSLVLEWMGAVDHFNKGKMYYSIPVLHKGAEYNDNDQQKPDNDNDQQKPKPHVGDYGVVRNSWYRFKLTDIMGIGTSVDNPAEPIVPNKVKTNDQLNITVEILPWHPIETTAPIL